VKLFRGGLRLTPGQERHSEPFAGRRRPARPIQRGAAATLQGQGPALLGLPSAQVRQCLFVEQVEIKRPFRGGHGLGDAAQPDQRQSQGCMGLRIGWVERYSSLDVEPGLLAAAAAEIGPAGVQAHQPIVRVQSEGAGIAGQASLGLAQRAQHVA
jgi:hypothetical protein